MSALAAALAPLSARAPLALCGRGDALGITAAAMVEHLGEAVREPDEVHELFHLPLRHLHRIEGALASYDFARPPWLASSMRESAWGDKATWNGKVAYLVAGAVVIAAPYALSLARDIAALSSPYLYSPVHKGWVVSDPSADAGALGVIIAEHQVRASADVAALVEGRGGWRESLTRRAAAAAVAGFALPTSFSTTRTLKDHQALAVPVMAAQGATLLADQVGLGKGGEFVCALLSLAEKLDEEGRPPPWPVVVSVPKSMRAEIAKEVTQWHASAKITMLAGTKSAPIDPGAQFIVLNHDILAARLGDILDTHPKAFIADESHVFKNEMVKRSKAAATLAAAVRANADRPYVVLASGTPFLNSPIELWSTLTILGIERVFSDYAMDRLGGVKAKVHNRFGWSSKPMWPKRAFETYFCAGAHDRYGAWHNDGTSNTIELNALLVEHGMVRRRKSDVMHPLPELFENVVLIEPSAAHRERYAELASDFRKVVLTAARDVAVQEGSSVEYAVRIALAKLVAGEQIMQMTALRQEVAAAKLEGTISWVHSFMDGSLTYPGPDGADVRVGDDPTRRKVILFVHHRAPRAAIASHPDLQRYGVVTIDPGGEMNDAAVQAAKARFQADPDIRLMVATMAAREGHTLTAAKDVYIHEIPFVPSWIVQMAGRCWARLSEDYEPHEATVHYAVAPGTIDIPSVRRVRLKSAIFSAVIDAEGQDESISDLRAEDLDSLVESMAITRKELGLAR